MLPPTPKNQHYVWKHYLDAWATSGKIACYRQREGKAFTPNTKNIASEAYFYRTFDLSAAELDYLEAVIASRPSEAMREIHRGFVTMFQLVAKLRLFLAHHGKPDLEIKAQSEALLNQAERSLGEQYHVAVEQKGAPLLARLRQRDAAFWLDENTASDFSYFIATQYLRTARMRNAVVGAVATVGIDIARVWSVESHFWSTEIGAALFANRHRYRAVILKNDSNIPFITGDQPTINLNAASVADMKLYYPVTPQTALMLTVESSDIDRSISRFEAEHLNHSIYRWSDDQIYGLEMPYLVALGALDKAIAP
jgi:hypothetical protein